MLTGIALSAEARRLSIPGRSKMSAAELRTAIAAATGPQVVNLPQVVPAQRTITVPGGRMIPVSLITGPQVPQVVTGPPVPFRSRNGKRKPSLPRSNRRH